MSGGTHWKPVRDQLEALAFDCAALLARRLSRRAVVRLARWLGGVVWRVSAHTRRIALANLDVAFRDQKTAAEKELIGREACRNFFQTMLGLLWSPALVRRPIGAVVTVDERQWQMVRTLQSQGKGIIFLTMHSGDWELLGLATGQLGVAVTTVMEPLRNRGLEQRLARLRSGTGNTLIPQRGAAVKFLRALRRGECVALLIDLNAPPRFGGVWVDFFGKPVFNNAAVAGLALRTGAPVIFGLGHPVGSAGQVRLEFTPIIAPLPTGHQDEDLRRLSQCYIHHCETIIRRQPESWLWSYKRWKRSPTADLTGFPFYTRPAAPVPPRRQTA